MKLPAATVSDAKPEDARGHRVPLGSIGRRVPVAGTALPSGLPGHCWPSRNPPHCQEPLLPQHGEHEDPRQHRPPGCGRRAPAGQGWEEDTSGQGQLLKSRAHLPAPRASS